MKIARTIGVETIQGPLIPAHGASPMLSVSFAESFGNSLSASAGEASSGATLDDVELPGTKLKTANPAAHTDKDFTLGVTVEATPAWAKNSHPNGTEQSAMLPGQGFPAANEQSISLSLKNASSAEIVQIANEEKDPQATPPSQPAAGENEGMAPLKEQPPDPGKMPGMETRLLDALTTELNRNTKQAAGHSFTEIKGDLKSRTEGTQSKAAKKDGAEAAAATTPAADGVPTITVTALPHDIVTAVPVETLNRGAVPDTVSKEKNPLGSVALANAQSRVKNSPATQSAKETESPNPLKSDRASEASDITPGSVRHEAKSSAEHPAVDSANIPARPEEKPHVALTELPPGVISTQAQVHAHTAPPLANISPDSARPAGSQAGTAAAAPHLYAADESRTLTATPTTLEVGVPGGTHGWLKVRAELAGDGAVHASVSSNSSSGTEMLRRELPTLTSYLHEEQVRVSSLVVHAPSSAMDLSNFSGGTNQHHEAGRDSMNAQEDGSRRGSAPTGQVEERAPQRMTEDDDGASGPLSIGYATGGGWLSIRA